jgi:hypothetical protein
VKFTFTLTTKWVGPRNGLDLFKNKGPLSMTKIEPDLLVLCPIFQSVYRLRYTDFTRHIWVILKCPFKNVWC